MAASSPEDVQSAVEEWQEATERLSACVDELVNAQSMRNRLRITECRRWSQEALVLEQEARSAMVNALALQQVK